MLRFCAAAALLTSLSVAFASARQDAISTADYLSHIRYLASDSLGGRGNGSEGLQRAGDYIASHLDSAGLQPAGDNGTFFQSFDGEMTVQPLPAATLTIRAGERAETFTVGNQYYPLSIIDRTHGEAAPVADGIPLMFAGYGISAPALSYDDFKGVDVRGKALVVFTHEPQEADARSVFDGTSLMPGAAVATKAREAMARGAAMLIVVDDPRITSTMPSTGRGGTTRKATTWAFPWCASRGPGSRARCRTSTSSGLARTIDITLTPHRATWPA